jgi:hypothetical protein
LIWERTEGNPFFTEEFTRSLFDDGVLVEREGTIEIARPCRGPGAAHGTELLRPASIASARTPSVAQVASVLGRQFDRRHLARLLESEQIDLDHHLAELERRGVIHRKNVLSADEYRFGESLTQEVAYEGMLLRERRTLHEQVGRLLEQLPGDAIPERAALMASHFARSDNHLKAIDALIHAGREAEQRASWRARRAFIAAWTASLHCWTMAPPLRPDHAQGADAAVSYGESTSLRRQRPIGLRGHLSAAAHWRSRSTMATAGFAADSSACISAACAGPAEACAGRGGLPLAQRPA